MENQRFSTLPIALDQQTVKVVKVSMVHQIALEIERSIPKLMYTTEVFRGSTEAMRISLRIRIADQSFAFIWMQITRNINIIPLIL